MPCHKSVYKTMFSLINSAINVALPTFAAQRRCCWASLSIDISGPHGAQQQTHRTPLPQSNDGTDGQTDTRPLRRPCSAYFAIIKTLVVSSVLRILYVS